jgi:hypothetical protein
MKIFQTFEGEFSDKDSDCSTNISDTNKLKGPSTNYKRKKHSIQSKLSALDPDKVFKVGLINNDPLQFSIYRGIALYGISPHLFFSISFLFNGN